MGRVRSAVLACSVCLLAACSGGATPSLPSGTNGGVVLTPPSTAPSESPSASASESAALSGSASTVPTSIDPCQLLTNDQAGMVNGETYGNGVGHASGNFKLCVWQNTSAHASVTVELVVTAGDTQAEQDYALAQAQNHGFAVEQLTGVGDAAVIARAPNLVKTGGIYVRKGATFFDVVYLNGTVPTDDQLTADANIILPELP